MSRLAVVEIADPWPRRLAVSHGDLDTCGEEWQANVAGSAGVPAAALVWAGSACRDVTAAAGQVHGAVGFALETGLHRNYRRAKSVQVWADAVCAVTGAQG